MFSQEGTGSGSVTEKGPRSARPATRGEGGNDRLEAGSGWEKPDIAKNTWGKKGHVLIRAVSG